MEMSGMELPVHPQFVYRFVQTCCVFLNSPLDYGLFILSVNPLTTAFIPEPQFVAFFCSHYRLFLEFVSWAKTRLVISMKSKPKRVSATKTDIILIHSSA
jgi:hypothetical protein